MKLEKATGSYHDLGTTWDIWSEAFAYYAAIMVQFFGTAFPHLHRALHHFQLKIRQLSRIYEWQNACLPLAFDFHSERTTSGPTNVDAWKLPAHWVDSFCTPQYVRTSSKKRDATTTLDGHSSKKEAACEVCKNFNTKGCSYPKCAREHKCTKCNSKDHGAHACTQAAQ